MAFTVPAFPLDVDIYAGPWLTRALRVSTVGNLAPGRRVFQNPLGEDPGVFIGNQVRALLLPALTDIRDNSCTADVPDVVEVPAGSGRWYGVVDVDDVGKGFDNEHRVALVSKIWAGLNGTEYAGLFWPAPIP